MIILIGGPTSSGKSSLAIDLALEVNGEIINGDAFQIYKKMDIGTAKPSKEEFLIVPHHLFDIKEIDEEYNIKEYQKDARRVIEDILKRNKTPIIVGGTGLYQLATLYDYEFKDEEKIDLSDLSSLSDEKLHSYLKELDPIEASKLHPHNRRRVLRAIEIYRASGEAKSALIEKQEHKLIYQDVIMIGINMDREELYDNINSRVDKMIELGLIEEVSNIFEVYGDKPRSLTAIGYKEIIEYLKGNMDKFEAIELIKKHTRNYAKRQMTFFKNKFKMNWFLSKPDAYSYVLERVKKNGEH